MNYSCHLRLCRRHWTLQESLPYTFGRDSFIVSWAWERSRQHRLKPESALIYRKIDVSTLKEEIHTTLLRSLCDHPTFYQMGWLTMTSKIESCLSSWTLVADRSESLIWLYRKGVFVWQNFPSHCWFEYSGYRSWLLRSPWSPSNIQTLTVSLKSTQCLAQRVSSSQSHVATRFTVV